MRIEVSGVLRSEKECRLECIAKNITVAFKILVVNLMQPSTNFPDRKVLVKVIARPGEFND